MDSNWFVMLGNTVVAMHHFPPTSFSRTHLAVARTFDLLTVFQLWLLPFVRAFLKVQAVRTIAAAVIIRFD